jgi:hypothetical protein
MKILIFFLGFCFTTISSNEIIKPSTIIGPTEFSNSESCNMDFVDKYTCSVTSHVKVSIGVVSTDFTCRGTGSVDCESGADPASCAGRACDIAFAVSKVCVERTVNNLLD